MGGSTASDKERDMGIGLIQPMHLLLILVIVLVVFGAGKLSQVGGALGQSVKDFKETVGAGEAEEPVDAAPAKPAPLARVEHKIERATVPTARPAELLQREEI
jgi:sec-independent protein translocase protein TatA